MLTAYPSRRAGTTSLKDAAWVDLVDPSAAESAAFEQAFGLPVPSKDALVEIEATSRLRTDHGALYMTTPLILAPENGPWIVTPTGFVLAKNIVATVRFDKLPAFDAVIAEVNKREKFEPAVPSCGFWKSWSIAPPTCWRQAPATSTTPRT